MRRLGLTGVIGLVGLTLVSACSVVLSTDEVQCTVDADCANRGFANAICEQSLCVQGAVLPEQWQCLGTVEEPVAKPGEMHTYRFRVFDFVTDAAAPGTAVLVCNIVDLDCASPLSGPYMPDPTGFVEAQVPSGFDGFFNITATDKMDTLLFPTLAIVDDVMEGDEVPLITFGVFNAVALAAGQTPDPMRGHALVGATDCNDELAAGVVFGIDITDPNTIGFYSVDNQPVLDAPSTDNSGNGGFLNIPVGFATIDGTLLDGGNIIGDIRFQVRANTLTLVTVKPTPL